MNPRSLALTALLLSTVLLLAPMVHGCVNFDAKFIAGDVFESPLSANLYEVSGRAYSKVCWYQGNADPNDGLYHLSCEPGYAAVFDSSTAAVHYTNAGGDFRFLTERVNSVWTASVFGC